MKVKRVGKSIGMGFWTPHPIWDVLFPNEQARIINLLIEKVAYNGEKGMVTINFQPLGIKTLAEEAGAKK